MKVFLLLSLLFSLNLSAQTGQDDMDRQIKEMMKARDEMLKSLLNDEEFQNFDKHFEDLIKNFQHQSFGDEDMMGGSVVGEYDWRETETHKIFVLKVTQVKDHPLDIKI